MNSTFVTAALLILLSLVSHSAMAKDTVELTRNSNVRTSRNFYGKSNVIDLIPMGATVEIISTKKLPSGANSLEIKILKPEDKISLNEKAPLYIWQSGLNIPKPVTATEADVTCPDGTCPPPSAVTESVKNIKDVTQAIEELDSESTSSNELETQIRNYSESAQVAKTIEWIKTHKSAGDGKCYRRTKEALATQTRSGKGPGNNLIPKWFGDRNSDEAKEGIKNLKQKGFINLFDNPEYSNRSARNAPNGSVLIYKHINRKGIEDNKPGHAEIKYDVTVDGEIKPQFFYGPIHHYPVNNKNGSRYVLIGIMIKSPMDDKQ